MTNPVSRVGSKSTGAGAANTPVGAASADVAASLKNVYLYLAVQQNEVLASELRNSVLSGQHKFRIPFTVSHRQTIAGGADTQATVQIQITSQYGKKLHSIVSTVANNTESRNLSADAVNVNGVKVKRILPYMDSRPLLDYAVSCENPKIDAVGVNAEDWLHNRQFIKNKSMNYLTYQMNWFWNTSFYDPVTGEEGIDLVNSDAGLDLEAVRLYQLELVKGDANPFIVYTYATYLKDVMIDAQGNILFG